MVNPGVYNLLAIIYSETDKDINVLYALFSLNLFFRTSISKSYFYNIVVFGDFLYKLLDKINASIYLQFYSV